jgi:hypothetical protein
MKPKRIKLINVVSCAIIFFGLFFGLTPQIKAQLVSVGILTFNDDSGSSVPGELCQRISRNLQQKLVSTYTDLLPRVIEGDSNTRQMTVPELTQMAKDQAVRYIVRGGILRVSSENIGAGVRVSIVLYAEIISSETGNVKSVRAKGIGTQQVKYPYNKVPWEAVDTSGNSFQYSAPGQAIMNAIDQLSSEVHDAATAPDTGTSVSSESESSSDSGETAETGETSGQEETYVEEGSEDYSDEGYDESYDESHDEGSESGSYSDDDLQQLIYQAEEFIYNNSLSEDKLKELQETLEKFKTALGTKATQLEQGEDTTQTDEEILQHKNKLEEIMGQAEQEVSSEESSGEEESYEETGGEKKNLLNSMGNVLDDSINVLQKIKELKSVLGIGSKQGGSEGEYETSAEEGYEEGYEETADTGSSESGETSSVESESGESGETGMSGEESADTGYEETGTEGSESGETDEGYVEDSGEEVTGVVTEGGDPVEGVEVTDPETGATATTDKSGFYNLGKIPAGRLSELVLKKNGKELAKGKIDLAKGKNAVADWDLKPKFSRLKQPTMRVMPSTVSVLKGADKKKYSGKTGTVKGVILNSKGKPMARTLVKLKGLGTARTDSRGRYVFMKVPEGNHQIVVQRSGLNPKVQTVKVQAMKSTMNTLRFAAVDRIKPVKTAPKLISKSSNSMLWGRVTDAKKRPVRGARVMVIQSGRSLSASTDATGTYRFRNLRAGAYRVIISKAGYNNSGGTVVLRNSKKERSNYSLSPASKYIQSALEKNRKRKTFVGKTKTGKTVVATVPTKKGTTGKTRTTPSTTRINTPIRTLKPSTGTQGALSGQVMDARTRRPLSAASVYISGRGGAATSGNGGFVIKNLPPGTYNVTVNKSGYASGRFTVKVPKGQVVRKNVYLTPGKSTQTKTTTKIPTRVIPKKSTTKIKPKTTVPMKRMVVQTGQLRGFVMDARTRKPVSGARITIRGARGMVTGRSGAFGSIKLKAGVYTVIVSKSGYTSGRKSVRITAGRSASVALYLTPRTVRKIR